MICNKKSQDNNSKLQSLLNKVNELPEDEDEMVIEVIDGIISIAEEFVKNQDDVCITLCYTDSSYEMQTVSIETSAFPISVAKGTLIFVVKNDIELKDSFTNCSKIYATDDGCVVLRADDNNFNINFYV